MSTELTFAPSGFPPRTRFVLVNYRVPRDDEHCALCEGIIENGYVRDVRTRLIYCDVHCLAEERTRHKESREKGVMSPISLRPRGWGLALAFETSQRSSP